MITLTNIQIPKEFRNNQFSKGNLFKTALIFIFFFKISSFIGSSSLLAPISLSFQDVLVQMLPDKDAVFTKIIVLGQEEYKSLFNETSPLDPKELKKVILKLLQYKPAILAIDLDTSSDSFSKSGLLDIESNKTKLVWARDASINEEGIITDFESVAGKPENEPPYSGVVTYNSDSDYKYRSFHKYLAFGSKSEDTFHWAILKAYCENRSTTKQCSFLSKNDSMTRPKFRNYDNVNHTLKSIIKNSFTPPDDNPFKDKVVILGGHYSKQDTGITPLGNMYGVNIIGQAVEAELSNDVILEPNSWIKYGLKISIGILIILINQRFRPFVALGLSFALIGGSCLLMTILGFYLGAVWIDVNIFFIAILLEQLAQGTENAQHMLELVSERH